MTRIADRSFGRRGSLPRRIKCSLSYDWALRNWLLLQMIKDLNADLRQLTSKLQSERDRAVAESKKASKRYSDYHMTKAHRSGGIKIEKDSGKRYCPSLSEYEAVREELLGTDGVLWHIQLDIALTIFASMPGGGESVHARRDLLEAMCGAGWCNSSVCCFPCSWRMRYLCGVMLSKYSVCTYHLRCIKSS